MLDSIISAVLAALLIGTLIAVPVLWMLGLL